MFTADDTRVRMMKAIFKGFTESFPELVDRASGGLRIPSKINGEKFSPRYNNETEEYYQQGRNFSCQDRNEGYKGKNLRQ